MNILRSRRARLAALSVGLAAVAVPTLAQPASAAVQSCEFVLKSVTADDVQEPRTRGDEIFIELDNQRFPSSGFVRFRANGVSAGAALFQNAKRQYADDNPLTVELKEVDVPLPNDQIATNKTLECTGDQTNQVLIFREPGVQYRLTYDVNLLD